MSLEVVFVPKSSVVGAWHYMSIKLTRDKTYFPTIAGIEQDMCVNISYTVCIIHYVYSYKTLYPLRGFINEELDKM